MSVSSADVNTMPLDCISLLIKCYILTVSSITQYCDIMMDVNYMSLFADTDSMQCWS